VTDLVADQSESPLAIVRQQAVQEQLLALERAAHRPVDGTLQRLGQRDEQRVGDVDDVGKWLGADPVDQLVEFLPQDSRLSLEHRDRHLAQQAGVGRHRAAGKRRDHARRVPQPIQEPRCFAEQR
jgi:hypothetical protein